MDTASGVSLLLLQPDDQIREQCLFMDPRTLARFTQTNKRIRSIGKGILATHKKNYDNQKSELLNLYAFHDGDYTVLMNENTRGALMIKDGLPNYSPESIMIMLSPRSEDVLSELANIKSVDNFGLDFNIYLIGKDLLSDQLKLDILSMAKKAGYTKRIDNRRCNKSLNEFSII